MCVAHPRRPVLPSGADTHTHTASSRWRSCCRRRTATLRRSRRSEHSGERRRPASARPCPTFRYGCTRAALEVDSGACAGRCLPSFASACPHAHTHRHTHTHTWHRAASHMCPAPLLFSDAAAGRAKGVACIERRRLPIPFNNSISIGEPLLSCSLNAPVRVRLCVRV